jgi:1,4-dihydroxy-2-naphthoate octaprenyltransferase
MKRQPVLEPSAEALGGSTPGRIAKRYLLATRPMFLPASLLPVILGTVIGSALAGTLDGLAFVLALGAIALVHGAINVLNDVYDDINGTDPANEEHVHPFTGGSRFIQNEVLSRQQMFTWGLVLLGLACVLGLALVLYAGTGVLVFGLMGILLGVAYSVPPVQLASRGLGELSVGLGFGVLPVAGAAWLQTGSISITAVVLSIPVAIWVANILLVNEVPDRNADAQAGKDTLVVRLGKPATATLYRVTNIVAAAVVAGAAVAGLVPLWAAAGPAALALGAWTAGGRIAAAGSDLGGPIRMTLAIHALGALWLTVSVAAG